MVEVPTKADLNAITFDNLKDWCAQLERGENIVGRVIQSLSKTRKELDVHMLRRLITTFINGGGQRDLLLGYLQDFILSDSIDLKTTDVRKNNDVFPDELKPISERNLRNLNLINTCSNVNAAAPPTPMEVDKAKPAGARSPRPDPPTIPFEGGNAEVELYVQLLVILFLVDTNKMVNSDACIKNYIAQIDQYEKRSLDPFLAKGFFYMTLVAERRNDISQLRGYLNSRLRIATLRNQTDTVAILIVCLLRVFLLTKNFSGASKLLTKVSFPESANNNDLARFLYYQGRIKAIELDYNGAAQFFQQALRKAPSDAAVGFKQNVHKWIVVIQLLQGLIPERSIFRVAAYKKPLAPYLELTHAVRLGDIILFNKIVETNKPGFTQDETITLIVRLRQNVIKTAIRQISLAYSKISIKDIARKLALSSPSEAEYMVTKAIKEGTIDARVSFDTTADDRYMQTVETENIYRTTEPQFSYDERIKHCLLLHNHAVKALRYPSDKGKAGIESIEQQREREQQELDFARDMADDDDDDDF